MSRRRKKGARSRKLRLLTKRRQAAPRPPRPSPWGKIPRWLWNAAGILAVIVGLWSAGSFAHRLSFPASDILDQSQPLSGPFVLKNDGWLSVFIDRVDLLTDEYKMTGTLDATISNSVQEFSIGRGLAPDD